MIESLSGALDTPLIGITNDGHVRGGLYAPAPPSAAGAASVARIAAAAQELLGTLSSDQQARLVFPLDAPERRSWFNIHPNVFRHGLLLEDLTPAQLLLVRLVGGPSSDVFGVGDDDQVIYGYAGADPRFLVHYGDYCPGAASHALQVNYRCPEPVVAATVKRELGWAALAPVSLAICGVQSLPCQSMACAGASPMPSHHTSPSSVSATLVKMTSRSRLFMQLGLVCMLVPGATPK